MKTRLMIGLMVGGLMAAMLPSVAEADAPGERPADGPEFSVQLYCELKDGGVASVHTTSPAGDAQSTARAIWNSNPRKAPVIIIPSGYDTLREACIPNTMTTTITKVASIPS